MIKFLTDNWLAVLGIIFTAIFGLIGLLQVSKKRSTKFKNKGKIENSVVLNNSDGNIVLQNQNVLTQLNELGEYEAVEKVLNKTIDTLVHPTHPEHYVVGTFTINNQIRLYSRPKNENSAKKFPIHLHTIVHPPSSKEYPYIDQYSDFEKYAFNTQKPVFLKIADIEQYIGDTIDPYPLIKDADNELTPVIKIEPYAPFPEARKSIIKCGRFSFITLLKRCPDPRKNILIMTNQEDRLCIYSLKLILNLEKVSVDIEFNIKKECMLKTNAIYNSVLFYHEIYSGKKFHLMDDEYNDPVVEGTVDIDENIESIYGLLEYYEMLLFIERKLKIDFIHPKDDNIALDDINLVTSIYNGLKDKYHIINLIEKTILFISNEPYNKNTIEQLTKTEKITTVFQSGGFTLLGRKFKVIMLEENYGEFRILNEKEFIRKYKNGETDMELIIGPKEGEDTFILRRKIIIKPTYEEEKRQ